MSQPGWAGAIQLTPASNDLDDEMRVVATWRIAGGLTWLATIVVFVILYAAGQKGLADGAFAMGAVAGVTFFVLQTKWTLRFLRTWFHTSPEEHQAYIGSIRRVGAVPFLLAGVVGVVLIVARLASL